MKRKLFQIIIICPISAMLLAGCGGNEAATSADDPKLKQEIAEEQITPTDTPVPEAPVSEEKEETALEANLQQDSSEPVDNFYVHRFDSYDDLVYSYKEAQDRHYTKNQIELIFGWGEAY